MTREPVSIPMAGGGAVSGLLDTQGPGGRDAGIVLAHGAGNDMQAPLLAAVASGLAGYGFPVLRFNFPYREAGASRPDPEPRLEAAWTAAAAFLEDRSGCRRLVAAGKSLGGRIASQMAAGGRLAAEALVFYGYPLHAPGKKERMRDAHLYGIDRPMLFFAGTRDALCDLSLLEAVLERIGGAGERVTVEGGDHSFVVPKSIGTAPDAVHRLLVERTVDFLARRL